MRVGFDAYPMRHLGLNAFQMLDFVHAHKMDAALLGRLTRVSPALDMGELQAVRQHADGLGVDLDIGLPSPNPHHAAPQVVALGDGSYRRGLERHIELAASLGCRLLHCQIGSSEDRLGQERPWAQHLSDTAAMLESLTPALRANGCRIAVETHREVTTFELIRIIEQVGSDDVGICLDLGNVLATVEDPVAAARRVAPYALQAQAQDCLLFFADRGLARQTRPVGDGSVDWPKVLATLGAANPTLTLTVEDHKGLSVVEIYNPSFLAMYPDVTVEELGQLVRLAWEGQRKISRGEVPQPEPYEAVPWLEQAPSRIDASVSYVRAMLQELGLAE